MSELSSNRDLPTENRPNQLQQWLLTQINWEVAIYVIITLIAIVSRFYILGNRVVSHDESLHTQYSYQFYNGEGYQHTPLMHGPYLFHITALFYWLFGANDFVARIPVAILGIVLVILPPLLLRPWLGRKGAIFSSLLLLISPYITYYSRYIRHDVSIALFAFIVFISTIYYLRERKNNYLWWFVFGLTMMFVTTENSFLYVAIFGSFLAVRLVVKLLANKNVRKRMGTMFLPLAVVGLGVMLVGGSVVVGKFVLPADETTTNENASLSDHTGTELLLDRVEAVGWIVIGVGLFLVVRHLRSHLDDYPEFDLVILYSTLILPSISAYLIFKSGVDALNYNVPCAGQGLGSLVGSSCLQQLTAAPAFFSAIVVIGLLIASIFVGLWWGGTKWVISAVIFYTLFTLFFTSFFTNMGGFASGIVGSLGYWLNQQEVQRGNQPWFYYFFAMPFYEFFPLILSILAAQLWLKQRSLWRHVGYFINLIVTAIVAYSFLDWLTNRIKPAVAQSPSTLFTLLTFLLVLGAVALFVLDKLKKPVPLSAQLQPVLNVLAGIALMSWLGQGNSGRTADAALSSMPASLVASLLLGGGIAYHFLVRRRQIAKIEANVSWRERLDLDQLFGFVPHSLWWLVMTWVAYSIAGEKMPWISTHFVPPMALLGGWYLQQLVKDVSWRELTQSRSLALLGLAFGILVMGGLTALVAMLDIDWGSQTQTNLESMGTLYGRIIVTIGLIALFVYVARSASADIVRRSWILGFALLLGLFTVRSNYFANFINYDYANEYLVYAHGGPGTKQQVLKQLSEISMRLYGDKSIDVRFDSDSSWPFYWYLREYPNNRFFGENPDASITEAPVLIVGNDNWGKVDAIVRDDYVHQTYIYLWWPMEEYRNFSWDAVFGSFGSAEKPRGLGSRTAREALWNIFFYRDYKKYGEVFGGNYRLGEWPLRDELRIYIKRDVLAKLWDVGTLITEDKPPVVPYANGQIETQASTTFGSKGSADGQLLTPRNVTVGPNGKVYVTDAGNHRIVIFNPDGSFDRAFGSYGSVADSAPGGQFNEPWGVAVDDQFIYVADTWNNRIQKFTLEGEFVKMFGVGGSPAAGQIGEALFFGPRDIELGSDGTLYVMDTGNHRIQHFDKEGVFIDQAGQQGIGVGEFSEPTGLALAPDGSFVVAEAWNRRIQRFSNNLEAVTSWQVDTWAGNSLNNKPYLAVDTNGNVYATDPEGYQVIVFNAVGEYIGRFGRFGTDTSSLDLPTGITTDKENNVYVVDANNGRVLKFPPLTFAPLPPTQE